MVLQMTRERKRKRGTPKGTRLSRAHRDAISRGMKRNKQFMEAIQGPRNDDWRAKIAASSQVNKDENPKEWERLYKRHLARLRLLRLAEEQAN